MDKNSKYFYDYECNSFAEILKLTDNSIEFELLAYGETFCMSLETFCKINSIYENSTKSPAVKFLDEQEYLFERLKHG